MAGSTLGTLFSITTWGESHGAAVGVTVDGCPAGLLLTEEDVQTFLDRRKPGQSKFTTQRSESDTVEILSGIFEGKTTGTPISMIVRNQDHRSKDYSNIMNVYRPGHADYTFDKKYGFRDYRGGGRTSGRETIGRVAAGAVASKLLDSLGIKVLAYTKSIGPVEIPETEYHFQEITENKLNMPNNEYAKKAADYLEDCMKNMDSSGGIIELQISGLPVGLGEPVFDKLDADLAKSMMSIGAVKGVEIGDGFHAAKSRGKDNNDNFTSKDGKIIKESNHSGGTLGGLSDGDTLILRLAIKPTPSIAQEQHTVTREGVDTEIEIKGRHDPVIVPRAVVVAESMAAITIADHLMMNMTSRLDYLKNFYK